MNCKNLPTLEKLVIRDNRVNVHWKHTLKLSPENFPKLKYLELPINSILDYRVYEEAVFPEFPELHIKYRHTSSTTWSH